MQLLITFTITNIHTCTSIINTKKIIIFTKYIISLRLYFDNDEHSGGVRRSCAAQRAAKRLVESKKKKAAKKNRKN